jgi:restriction system protein
MLPLLELAGDDKTHRVREAVALLAKKFGLTEEEQRALIPSGRGSRFHNNVTWARTYMKKAGLLADPERGAFRITERGRTILADKPAKIDTRLLRQFREFNDFLRGSPSPGPVPPPPDPTPEDALQSAYQILRNSLAADLLDQVRRSSPAFFERLVVDVLVRMGSLLSH